MRSPLFLCLLTVFATIIASNLNPHGAQTQDEIKKDRRNGIWDRKDDKSNDVVNSNDKINFSDHLYDILRAEKEKNKENFVIAPLGAKILLSMLAFGAGGSTLEELQNVVGIKVEPSTLREFNTLMSELNNVQNVTLKVLNKLYIPQNFQLKQLFERLTRLGFASEIENIDFTKRNEAVQTINNWIAKNTNNKIKNLIIPSDIDIDAQSTMIGTNVIYFNGQWKEKFEPQLTSKQEFNGRNGEKHLVDVMNKDSVFQHASLKDLKASFIEIPYKNNDVVMLVIVPDEIDGLAEVEQSLKSLSLQDLRRKSKLRYLNLYLPKFKVETTIQMKPLLSQMGLRSMFSSSANFEKISDLPLSVSSFRQKVYIEVSEGGTEAAAATMLGMAPHMGLPPPFIVDRPFHYKIIKNTNDHDGIVLFAGNIYDLE